MFHLFLLLELEFQLKALNDKPGQWTLILPHLLENEQLLHHPIQELLYLVVLHHIWADQEYHPISIQPEMMYLEIVLYLYPPLLHVLPFLVPLLPLKLHVQDLIVNSQCRKRNETPFHLMMKGPRNHKEELLSLLLEYPQIHLHPSPRYTFITVESNNNDRFESRLISMDVDLSTFPKLQRTKSWWMRYARNLISMI